MSASHNPEHGSGSVRPHPRSMQQGGTSALCLARCGGPGQERRRDGPAMAVIGDYGNRLAIVARQHALNRAAPVRLEGNPLANPELEHIRVGADVLQQTKALDDPMVEVDQFGFHQPVNIDHHEASPSALNGVSTLQRPAGKRKPRNGREASAMAVLSEGGWQEYCSYPGTLSRSTQQNHSICSPGVFRKCCRLCERYRQVQGSRVSLAGDDPKHVVVIPGGLLAPTAQAGLTAAIGGNKVEGYFA